MQITRRVLPLTAFAVVLFAAVPAPAQAPATFKVRLSPVPMDAAMRTTIAGSGAATAALQGTILTVTGSFDGMKSPATIAQIHRGVVTGVRGPVIFDLNVSKGMSGTLTGSVDLSPEQIESLRKGQLYIQIHSEKAPEGNLWGWLLP